MLRIRFSRQLFTATVEYELAVKTLLSCLVTRDVETLRRALVSAWTEARRRRKRSQAGVVSDVSVTVFCATVGATDCVTDCVTDFVT
eukprot:1505372-Pyramimonas_sp.AAC.1